MRRSPLPRCSTPLPRNKKPIRKQAPAKNGAEPDWAFREFVRHGKCILDEGRGGCWYPEGLADPAHIEKWRHTGIDRSNIVRLCRRHHGEQESIGNAKFQCRHNVSLKDEAAKLVAEYDAAHSTFPSETR